uniref:class I SAM-dependent methyltransferase n=1 Tax=Pedobacter schmidteae TaxID=2201271 RepID=UPI000EB2D057|nr:class I SAM-dependent methyltransferase [Pedobacter schmidteae]
MKSKITGGETSLLFTAKILNKYDIKYYKCLETGFIQTEEPYWLDEAYSEAITKLDIGLVSRNEELREVTAGIIESSFNGDAKFIDYAGGYGIFTRMMRDKGYDFYHHDNYCKNIFAEFFDLSDCNQKNDFELVSAFEVLEHLANPLEEIEKIASLGKNMLVTTMIQPEHLESIDDWWYFIPETGQHISFYTLKALEYIAKELGMYLTSNGTNMHLFTKEKLTKSPFESKKEPYLIGKMRRKVSRYDLEHMKSRESLISKDWQMIRSKIIS